MLVIATWVVGALAALRMVDASVDYNWIKGKKGEDCDTTCQEAGRHCIGGSWPTNVKSMLDVDSQSGDGRVGCVHVVAIATPTATSAKSAPFFNPLDGKCTYNPVGDHTECAEKPARLNDQRFCRCSTKPARWMLADVNDSCTDFCGHRGGKCGSDPGLWHQAEGWDEVNKLTLLLGMSCGSDKTGANDVVPIHAPSLLGDKCYFLNVGSQDLGNCEDKKVGHRRICPCIGASLTPVLSSDESPNIGAVHAVKTGAEGACRWGGFVIGRGVGGTPKHVAGGLLANNNEECRQRVMQYCPDSEDSPEGRLNGATYKHDTKECFCEYGITKIEKTTGFNVCWFTDEIITQGAGDLISKYKKFTSDVTARLPTSTTSLCSFIAVVGAAIAVSLRHWRHPPGSTQVDDGEDHHAQAE